MPNKSGQTHALLVLTPILPGREAALRDALDRLPMGAASPLARTGKTHFARWVVIDRLLYSGPPQRRDTLRSAYLLFSCHYDGELEAYLDDLRALLPAEADAIWGHCVGYPGVAEPEAFKAWLRRDRLDATFYFAPYGEATLPRVLAALELKDKLLAFALAAQGLDAPALREAYQRTFGFGVGAARREPPAARTVLTPAAVAAVASD